MPRRFNPPKPTPVHSASGFIGEDLAVNLAGRIGTACAAPELDEGGNGLISKPRTDCFMKLNHCRLAT